MPATATVTAPARYIDRKTHKCGCTTVWDTTGGGARFEHACGAHKRYAHNWPAIGAR